MSDDGSDDATPNETEAGTESTDGESTSGQSTSGQSSGGQSTGGQSSSGRSSSGQSNGGQSTGGQSSSGQSSSGQSTSGSQSSNGQSAGAAGQRAGQSTGHSTGQTAGGSQTTGGNGELTGPAAGGTGLEPNVAAAIAYVFAPLTGVLMLLLEGDDDDFVRFHSIQSIGFGVAAIGVYIVTGVVFGILTVIPFIGDIFGLLVFPINGLIGLAAFGVWVLLILKAYQGERYALPVLGPIAASN